MSTRELIKLAEVFENKLWLEANGRKKTEAPPEANLTELAKVLDPREMALIKINDEYDDYYPHNPPASVASEKTWNRAKKLIKRYWKKYKSPWGAVFQLYLDLGGKLKKPKKRKK